MDRLDLLSSPPGGGGRGEWVPGEPNASDNKMLPSMLATTAENFKIAEVSGDTAYC